MADERVVNFIKSHISKGYPQEQIINSLKANNWPENVINEAMQVATGGSNPIQQQPISEVHGKGVPVLVKVIAVLIYIGAGFEVIGGVASIAGGGLLGSLGLFSSLGFLGTNLFMILGGILIGFAVLEFFIGRGLWKAQKWARMIMIIFSGFGIAGELYYIVSRIIESSPSPNTYGVSVVTVYLPSIIVNGAIGIVISGLIGGYLLFSKKVKEAFSR